MKQALFARTGNLRELIVQVRAHDAGAADILESQVTDRMVNLVGRGDRARGEAAIEAARAFVAGLGVQDGGQETLDTLWEAIERIEGRDGDEGDPDARAIERMLRRSLDELARRDPAAHARLARLVRGDLAARRDPADPSERRGARGVLARTEITPGDGRATSREEGRELLRWREILGSLLPEGHRPSRRLVVPGGVACLDPDGPRLSWQAISGTRAPGEEGAFEAHLLSCDHCFEFHYRTRRAIRVLQQRNASLLTPPGGRGGSGRAGILGALASLFGRKG